MIKRFNKLKKILQEKHPEIYEEFEKDGLFESSTKTEVIIPAPTRQIILRNLGYFASSRLNVGLYYLLYATDILRNEVREERIKLEYGEIGFDWKEEKEKIEKLRKKICLMKTYYDSLEDKQFYKLNKKDKEATLHSYFMKAGSKIAYLQPSLFRLFHILFTSTNVQRYTIPSDAFKVLEHTGMKKMESKKPSLDMSNIVKESDGK